MSYYYTNPSIFDRPSYYYPKYTTMYDSPWTDERVSSPLFRYEPLSRFIYSATPRKIYPWDYENYEKCNWPKDDYFKAEKTWLEHLKRLEELDKYYPKYHIYPKTTRPRLEDRGSSLPPVVSRKYYPLSNLRTTHALRSLTLDPWYYEYPELRPYRSPYLWSTRYPFYTRTTYLTSIRSCYPYTTYTPTNTYYWM